MRIIYKSFISNINFIRYLIIISLLLILFFSICSLSTSIDNYIFKENNTLNNRTFVVELIDSNDSNKLYDIEYISYVNVLSDNEYEIIFDDYRDIDTFRSEYEGICNKIISYDSSTTDSSVLEFINYILIFFSYVIMVIVSIVILISFIDVILSYISNISLLKLMGYSNGVILRIVISFIFIMFNFIFLLSIILFGIINIIINMILSAIDIDFVLSLYIFNNVFSLYVILLIVIVLVILFIIYRVRKISPIEFMRKNLSL